LNQYQLPARFRSLLESSYMPGMILLQASGGKMRWLDKVMPELRRARPSRCNLFPVHTQVLDLLEEELNLKVRTSSMPKVGGERSMDSRPSAGQKTVGGLFIRQLLLVVVLPCFFSGIFVDFSALCRLFYSRYLL
jgi:hypothetical protein